MTTLLKSGSIEPPLQQCADQFHFTPFDMRAHTTPLLIDPLFCDDMIWRLRAVPIFFGKHHVVFAMDEPQWVDDVDTLNHLFSPRHVVIRVVDPDQLQVFMVQHHGPGRRRGEILRLKAHPR
ncbi:MAG: hypothetical protein V4697_02480 [Patescibacteria group bacterium]